MSQFPTISEKAGGSLGGAINGTNTVFTTSYDYDDAFVQVYLNGLCLFAGLDDGYTLSPPRTVILKEAPIGAPGDADTLEIVYRANTQAGGGAEVGGCPDAPILNLLRPEITTVTVGED